MLVPRCMTKLFLATALLLGPVVGQKTAAAGALDAELLRAFDAVVAAQPLPFWGAVLVAQKGRVVFAKGYGLQDFQHVAIGPRSLFDIGGLSRVITVTTGLQMQLQQKWSLQDEMSRVVPDVPKDKLSITLQQLMLQTAGMPAEVTFVGAAAAARKPALAALLGCQLVLVPGAGFSASQRSDNLLAACIELAAGESFEAVAQKRVFAPFGMRDSGFVRDNRLDEKRMTWRKAPGDSRAVLAREVSFDWSLRGAQGVLASAADLHELCAALTGDKLWPLAQQYVFAPFAGGDACFVRPVELMGQGFVELHGAVTGYRTRLLLHQASRSWLVMCCGEVDPEPMLRALAVVFVPLVAGAPPAFVKPTAEAQKGAAARFAASDQERFCGVFAHQDGGFLTVQRQADALLVLGVGMQASARIATGQRLPLAKADELRKVADRGLVLLQRMTKDATLCRPSFVGDAEALAARQLFDSIRPRLQGQPAFTYIGTELAAPRASWFQGRVTDGVVTLRLLFAADERCQSLSVSREPPPFCATFRVVQRDLAIAKVGNMTLSITVEGEGAARMLVLEDGSVGADGLVEFRWCAESR